MGEDPGGSVSRRATDAIGLDRAEAPVRVAGGDVGTGDVVKGDGSAAGVAHLANLEIGDCRLFDG